MKLQKIHRYFILKIQRFLELHQLFFGVIVNSIGE